MGLKKERKRTQISHRTNQWNPTKILLALKTYCGWVYVKGGLKFHTEIFRARYQCEYVSGVKLAYLRVRLHKLMIQREGSTCQGICLA